MVKNQEGEFLLPTPETMTAAASKLDARTPPDERLTLVFAPGRDSYPLIAYEYAVVSTRQRDPAVAEAIRKFLKWAASPTGGYDGIPGQGAFRRAAAVSARDEREADRSDQVVAGRARIEGSTRFERFGEAASCYLRSDLS